MNCSKFTPRKIVTRNYRKYEKKQFQNELREQPWASVLNSNDANIAWSAFKSIFNSLVDKHAPLVERKVRGQDCPWLTNDIRENLKDRDYHLRKARKSNNDVDWAVYRKLRNTVTRKIKWNKANYNRETLRENITKPKQFWQKIKKCIGKSKVKSEEHPAIIVNGKLSVDKKEISNGFCNFFTNIGKSLQKSLQYFGDSKWKKHDHSRIERNHNPNKHRFMFKDVSTENIMKKIASLKVSKASGYDNIPVKFIKDGVIEIAPVIACLINKCLQTSVFPTDEKIAKVTPI